MQLYRTGTWLRQVTSVCADPSANESGEREKTTLGVGPVFVRVSDSAKSLQLPPSEHFTVWNEP